LRGFAFPEEQTKKPTVKTAEAWAKDPEQLEDLFHDALKGV
jgi:hypothetical protein